jgi:hypothetical protein
VLLAVEYQVAAGTAREVQPKKSSVFPVPSATLAVSAVVFVVILLIIFARKAVIPVLKDNGYLRMPA